jgi:two-component system NarL family response regulator
MIIDNSHAMLAKTRLLLVDDHAILRKGLSMMLDAQPDMEVVGEAPSGEVGIIVYRECNPDVVLMDLKMGGISGIDAIEKLRSEFPAAKIIVLSSYDRDEDIYRSIRAGAMGYLVKDASADEMLLSIRSVMGGHKHFPSDISEKLADRLTITDLSIKEHEVLKLLARGMSNISIADSLCVSPSAVKYHINNILSKLNATDRTQAVITALKMGLVDL